MRAIRPKERRSPGLAPFEGVDRTGMPDRPDLGSAETHVPRRLSPLRNRWPDVAQLDTRVAELEQRQAAVGAELAAASERLRNAPSTDAERLARWQLEGGNGPRPELEQPGLEETVKRLQQDYDGLTVAIGRVLEDKASLVERHRPRLVKDADRSVHTAHERYVALITETAAARQELAELRQAAVWARLYPDGSASHSPPQQVLAGGLRAPVERTLGIAAQLQVEAVFNALRADGEWLRDAATPQQRAALEGREAHQDAAVWADTEEGRERDRQERKAALARYKQMWGREPA